MERDSSPPKAVQAFDRLSGLWRGLTPRGALQEQGLATLPPGHAGPAPALTSAPSKAQYCKRSPVTPQKRRSPSAGQSAPGLSFPFFVPIPARSSRSFSCDNSHSLPPEIHREDPTPPAVGIQPRSSGQTLTASLRLTPQGRESGSSDQRLNGSRGRSRD